MKLPTTPPVWDLNAQPELKNLADHVGSFIEYWGFKSVQGKLWFYLFVSQEPLSSIDLAQILEVSPALITQSVQVLLDFKVILPAEKGRNGMLRFRANPHVSEAIAGVLSTREFKLLETIEKATSRASKSSRKRRPPQGIRLDPKKLEQIGHWTSLAKLMLGTGIQTLKTSDTPFGSL